MKSKLRSIVRTAILIQGQCGWNIAKCFLALCRFASEYREFKSLPENPSFRQSPVVLYPCMTDKTAVTPLEPTYFFQDSWAAGCVFRNRPKQHVDVGSAAKTIGIISQFVPTTFIDIRPIELHLDGLTFKDGSILALPYGDASVESISSLCVVEHIGLGRYGDALDSFGSEKAIRELQRVVAPGGNLYLSLPVDSENRVYFNAHRSFTRGYVMSLFHGFRLVESQYHYGKALYADYDPAKGFGTGLFHFRKGE
jgi:hypothetical protein